DFDGGPVIVPVQLLALIAFVADEVPRTKDEMVLRNPNFETLGHCMSQCRLHAPYVFRERSRDHDPGYGNGMIPSRKATNKDAAVRSAEVPGLRRRVRSQASKAAQSTPVRDASARTSSATSRPCLRSIKLSRNAAMNAKCVATIAASKSPSADS